MAKPKKTFYDWCIENDRQDILELWDYTLNKVSPKDVGFSSKNRYYFKCSKGVHDSEFKALGNITKPNSKNGYFKCNQCNSFGQYLIDEFGENALELYWDYEMNKVNPFEIAKCFNGKVWIKCQKQKYHGSYEISCGNFYNGKRCSYCASNKIHPLDSFGQMLIDEYGTLDSIWDYEKNGDLDPFGLAKNAKIKVWLFCRETDYHSSYDISCANFNNGYRCSYCGNQKTHPRDSLGQKLIDNYSEDAVEKYWSNKNTTSPFKVAPYSMKKYWFICQNDKSHKDYETTASNFSQGNRCPECKESKGERKIREILNTYNINFIPQKEFSDLVGTSEWKPLSYDFYLPEHNLLIEYQGNYHDGTAKQQTEEDFIKQREHDRRKREYSKLHNIKLLEIWYWDFDNIEEILIKNIK